MSPKVLFGLTGLFLCCACAATAAGEASGTAKPQERPTRVDQPQSEVTNVVPDAKYADFVWRARIDRKKPVTPRSSGTERK